ncbi:Wilm's tumor protein [Cordyceps fumosorosea ARSEF 2679]|uniref:Wilm's tumor protein n=1 Tax=Cordyceps fumosorosea (strain ARSEF 2679) TaxID=1081104 RepID=A0A168DC43_CORFA|nr:Wilm's tumor protein [Cordyceps fumosorosea ARSEF 2679]OAA72423.1 Wilm's tumor protein [Cordyceps fumosorosea ARSEF 2679]
MTQDSRDPSSNLQTLVSDALPPDRPSADKRSSSGSTQSSVVRTWCSSYQDESANADPSPPPRPPLPPPPYASHSRPPSYVPRAPAPQPPAPAVETPAPHSPTWEQLLGELPGSEPEELLCVCRHCRGPPSITSSLYVELERVRTMRFSDWNGWRQADPLSVPRSRRRRLARQLRRLFEFPNR